MYLSVCALCISINASGIGFVVFVASLMLSGVELVIFVQMWCFGRRIHDFCAIMVHQASNSVFLKFLVASGVEFVIFCIMGGSTEGLRGNY
jgi:hypothetical protein